jgi:hypothetical protein
MLVSIGGYVERAMSIFNAFEIYEGVEYKNINITRIHDIEDIHNKQSFLNKYSQDIHTKYIENITGNYNDVNFCMFNAQCYLNGKFYSCERINKNDKNGLYFKSDDIYHENAFDIEGEDPRIFIFKEKVYVVFICLSPYKNQLRCIGITPFEKWDPVFLQIENMPKNHVEKNWVPFIKDDKLYFVYNYDPLIIIHYNFNRKGICNVAFKQNSCNLPINQDLNF